MAAPEAFLETGRLSLLQLYFDGGFRCLMVPFRVKLDSRTGKYVIVTNKIQSVQQISIEGFEGLYSNAVSVSRSMQSNNPNIANVVEHLQVLESKLTWMQVKNEISLQPIALSCRFFLVTYGFFASFVWFKPKDIVNVIESTELHIRRGNWIYKIVSLVGFIGFILYTIKNYKALPKYLYVLQSKHNNTTEYSSFWQNILDSKLMTFAMFECFTVHALSTYVVINSFHFMLSFSLIGLAREFRTNLQLSGNSVQQGLRIYQHLKRKLKLINAAVGHQVMGLFAVLTAYYCGIPDVLTGIGDKSKEPIEALAFYFVFNLTAWVVAAEFNSKVTQTVLDWQAECFNKANRNLIETRICNKCGRGSEDLKRIETNLKLMSIKNELQTHPLALSCNVFPITYRFLSSGLLAYRNLRTKISFINQVFGGQVFGFFLAVTTYYSQFPEVLMGYLTDHPLGVLVPFILLDMAILILAAEFHSQVQRISFEGFEDLSRNVLEYKRKFKIRSVSSTEYLQILESKLDLMEMKNEISLQPIALSCRFFSITYGFLASGISAYKDLKKKLSLINILFEGQLFSFFVAVIAFYSRFPESILLSSNHQLGIIIPFLVLDTILLILAAEFHYQVQQISIEGFEELYSNAFISESRSMQSNSPNIANILEHFQVLERKLSWTQVKNEISLQPIALSCRFFSVTYGFFASGLLAYRNLRTKISFINDVFGGPLFGFFLAVITYYSQFPDVLMGTNFSQINKLFETQIIAFAAANIPYYCEIPDVISKYLSEEPTASVAFYMLLNTSILILAAELN
ncbi:unnamed protein product [Orchesella dallaii]|uniref:Gustatory receptor n=1 Tax=Orchesella dallaii TaxID=48710 RepID=A0ABP1QH37_9HEXA